MLAVPGAGASTFTFDTSADLTSNFNLDVVFGDNNTGWRTGYAAAGGFPDQRMDMMGTRETFKKLKTALLGLAIVGAMGGGGAQAAVVTSDALFSNPSVIDFSQFAGSCGGFAVAGCVPSLDVGGLVGETVTFTGTGSSGAAVYNGFFGLGANRGWNSGRNGYVATGSPTAFAEFTWGHGLTDVGAFVNYSPGLHTPLMEILGLGGGVLETVNIAVAAAISTPVQTNAGAFRGFSRATNDIFGIRYTGSFLVIDDLTFSTTAVPLPAALPLFATALAGMGLLGWRRRRKAAV